MIDLKRVRQEFRKYINQFDNQNDPGFELKVVHTAHVVECAKEITTKMGLSKEEIELAELIAYLHDIGRFDELKKYKSFTSTLNDHALFGSSLLFEQNKIRDFIDDPSYDRIIQKAIENHNKLSIEEGLNEQELLQAKIIRDADKLDNYRVCVEENIENRFAGLFQSIDEFNQSSISDKVYQSFLNHELVNIRDRVVPLDYWLCVLAFLFDFSFKETLEIVKEKNYIDQLIDMFDYQKEDTKEKMEIIRQECKKYLEEKISQ